MNYENYISKYTGKEIDEAVGKASNIETLVTGWIKLDSTDTAPINLNILTIPGNYTIDFVSNGSTSMNDRLPVNVSVSVIGNRLAQFSGNPEGNEVRYSTDNGATWGSWQTIEMSSHVYVQPTEPQGVADTTLWVDTSNNLAISFKIKIAGVWRAFSIDNAMLQSVYDPQGKEEDVFAYIDARVQEIYIALDYNPNSPPGTPTIQDTFMDHVSNLDPLNMHVTQADKDNWNQALTLEQAQQEIQDRMGEIHDEIDERLTKVEDDMEDVKDDFPVLEATINTHLLDTSVHVSQVDKDNWDSKSPANHTHFNDGRVTIDASKITGGTLDPSLFPTQHIEHVVTVADDTERFALTTAQVRKGYVVYVKSTKKLYIVIDETKLNSAAGYREYPTGIVGTVDWDDILNKPTKLEDLELEDAPYTPEELEDVLNDIKTDIISDVEEVLDEAKRINTGLNRVSQIYNVPANYVMSKMVKISDFYMGLWNNTSTGTRGYYRVSQDLTSIVFISNNAVWGTDTFTCQQYHPAIVWTGKKIYHLWNGGYYVSEDASHWEYTLKTLASSPTGVMQALYEPEKDVIYYVGAGTERVSQLRLWNHTVDNTLTGLHGTADIHSIKKFRGVYVLTTPEGLRWTTSMETASSVGFTAYSFITTPRSYNTLFSNRHKIYVMSNQVAGRTGMYSSDNGVANWLNILFDINRFSEVESANGIFVAIGETAGLYWNDNLSTLATSTNFIPTTLLSVGGKYDWVFYDNGYVFVYNQTSNIIYRLECSYNVLTAEIKNARDKLDDTKDYLDEFFGSNAELTDFRTISASESGVTLTPNYFQCIRSFPNNRFIAGCMNGEILTFTSKLNDFEVYSQANGSVRDIIYVAEEEKYYAIAGSSIISFSKAFNDIAVVSQASGIALIKIFKDGNKFVCIGYKGVHIYNTSLNTWSNTDFGVSTYSINDAMYYNGKYYCVGYGPGGAGIQVSFNVTFMNSSIFQGPNELWSILHVNDMIVCGGTGKLVVFPDTSNLGGAGTSYAAPHVIECMAYDGTQIVSGTNNATVTTFSASMPPEIVDYATGLSATSALTCVAYNDIYVFTHMTTLLIASSSSSVESMLPQLNNNVVNAEAKIQPLYDKFMQISEDLVGVKQNLQDIYSMLI
jgi:hypothetical protein